MYDKALVLEILRQLQDALRTILRRFEPVTSVHDFTGSDAGMEKFDAICMMLIAIGESLKHLDKITNGILLSKFPRIDWKNAKGMRDVISHHYFKVDAEVIYHVCGHHIPSMLEAIDEMVESSSSELADTSPAAETRRIPEAPSPSDESSPPEGRENPSPESMK